MADQVYVTFVARNINVIETSNGTIAERCPGTHVDCADGPMSRKDADAKVKRLRSAPRGTFTDIEIVSEIPARLRKQYKQPRRDLPWVVYE